MIISKYFSLFLFVSVIIGGLSLSTSANARFKVKRNQDVGITGEIGDEAKNLNSQAMDFSKITQKSMVQRRQRKELFKVYENRYVWLFSTFVPAIDYKGKSVNTNLNFVSATDILKKEDAHLLCLKVVKIKDLSLEYLSSHPIHLGKDGNFNSIITAKNVADYLTQRLGFKVLKYMIVFEGLYAKIHKNTKIHGFLPKNLILRCSELKGKLGKDKKKE